MPAKRLPWIKFWPELLEHRKFGELTDSESWTWVVVWGKASQQPERWKFSSIDHAARATGRPRKQIKRLIDVHLVDEDRVGRLTIHDVKQWQERFPSDGPPEDHSRSDEDSAKAPSTLLESSVNGASKAPSTLREHSDSSLIQTGEERREINSPQSPPGGRRAIPKPKPERVQITDGDIEDLVAKYAESYGNRQSVRDEIEAALNHTARYRSLKERLYVDVWLRRELAHRPGWRVVNGRGTSSPPRAPIDRTGVAN